MRRMLTNLEVLGRTEDSVTVGANFALHEYRHVLTVWAGRVVYRLRRGPDGLRMAAKTVHLVNAGGPVPTLAFLI
jgi:3-phenylpropionate/cinnamic acid dioxygenase small subunit